MVTSDSKSSHDTPQAASAAPGEKTAITRAPQLREHAAKFRGLADALKDEGICRALRALAAQCEQLAEACEAQASRK